MSDGGNLTSIAERGAQKARANAETTMKEVRKIMGL